MNHIVEYKMKYTIKYVVKYIVKYTMEYIDRHGGNIYKKRIYT